MERLRHMEKSYFKPLSVLTMVEVHSEPRGVQLKAVNYLVKNSFIDI